MLENLKVYLEISDKEQDALLGVLLDDAKDIVLNRRYPTFEERPAEFPKMYERTVVRIAVYLYNRMGSEGEVAHSEGSISRTYKNSNIPSELLEDVIPLVKVIK